MLCYMCVCFAFSDLCVDSIRTCASRELDRPFFQFTDLGPTSSSHWRGAFPAFRTSDFPSMTASRVGTMLIVSAVRFRPSIRSATFFLPWPLAPGISFPSTPKVEARVGGGGDGGGDGGGGDGGGDGGGGQSCIGQSPSFPRFWWRPGVGVLFRAMFPRSSRCGIYIEFHACV